MQLCYFHFLSHLAAGCSVYCCIFIPSSSEKTFSVAVSNFFAPALLLTSRSVLLCVRSCCEAAEAPSLMTGRERLKRAGVCMSCVRCIEPSKIVFCFLPPRNVPMVGSSGVA